MRRGFSLVELSIVLVILGLLTGGILAGQSLIRASELRSVSVEYGRYLTAAHNFRDKYFSIPGDFRDATRVWGRLQTTGGCNNNSSAAVTTPGACDGDGSGTLEAAGGASQSGENMQLWRHLALAGLIEGTYTGLSESGGSAHVVPGTNAPRGRISNSGWYAGSAYNFAGNSSAYAGDYQNMYFIGATRTNTAPTNPLFLAEEAWNLDTKMDDGQPGGGRIFAYSTSGWYNAGTNADACTLSTTFSDKPGSYNLAARGVQCGLYFLRAM